MKKAVFLFFFFSILLSSAVFLAQPVFAEEDNCNSVPDDKKSVCLNDLIAKYQKQLRDAQGQEKTLKSQLIFIDTQAKVTELKIAEAENQIAKLDHEITDLDTRIVRLSATVDELSQVLLNRIVETYKYGNYSAIDLFFSSNGFSDLINKVKYISVAQANDKKVLYQLQATKTTYNDQKVDKQTRQAQQEKLKKDLNAYQIQLEDQKKAKDKLLKDTQNDEETYQRLLSQAQAQLAAFSSFTASLGGATPLSNQTVCDDGWQGCYFNQRDTKWGGLPLNGTSYSIASDGCLVTSMAMIYTHYGHRGVTPITINSNPNNFASYFPAFLNKVITADGATSERIRGELDSELSAGRPVIVGIGRGPAHFMVIISGSNGNYKMNDPFTPNGHNINFTDHYSLNSISEIDKVNF